MMRSLCEGKTLVRFGLELECSLSNSRKGIDIQRLAVWKENTLFVTKPESSAGLQLCENLGTRSPDPTAFMG